MVRTLQLNHMASLYAVSSKHIISDSFRRYALTAALMLVIGLLYGTFAPHATLAQNAPQDTCDDVRYLIQHEVTPDSLLQGGGTISPGQTVTGGIGPDDIGDHWSFVVTGATNSTTMTVSFSGIPAGINLEIGLFRGMERLIDSSTYLPVASGQTYSLKTPRDGIYTLVVQLARISTIDGITQAQQYQMMAVFNGNNDVEAELAKRRLRDAQTSQDFVYQLQDGKQVLAFSSGAEFLVNPGSLAGVSNRNDAAGQIIFDPRGSLMAARWAQTVSALGGNLSVTGNINGQTRLFYLENFGYEGTLVNAVQSNFEDITDSNGTRIATDWDNITGLWVMTDCMGYRLADGSSFIVPISDQQVKRSFIVRGNPDPVAVDCSAFYVRMDALDTAGSTVNQSLCFTWQPISPRSEVMMNQGMFHAQLRSNRTITLQSNTIRLLLYQANNAPGIVPELPLDISLKVQGQDVAIRLDWVNLLEFSYLEEPGTGRQLHFRFSDEPRSATSRPGDNLLFLDALQDVIHIVYRGDGQNGADGRELLLLPRENSYLEIETPAGNPTFGGLSFDGTALPGQPGYQPRGVNNLGGECYPVNTALNLNCSPNGDINPANSNFWYAVTDLIAYSPVSDLALTRSYNSYDYAVDGPFGLGWSSPFSIDYAAAFNTTTNSRPVAAALTERQYPVGLDLTWAPRGIVTFKTASGSLHTFVRDTTARDFSGEIFRALTMPGWSLNRTGSDRRQQVLSSWVLATDSGLTYEFDRGGRLVSLGYPAQSYRLTIEYPWEENFAGPANQIVVISDDLDRRKLELTYDENAHVVMSRLWDLTVQRSDAEACKLAESCFEVRYRYDGDYLVSVTYSDGQVATYTYENGRLKRHDDPHAPIAPIMTYEYGQGGAVTSAVIESVDTASIVWRKLEAIVDGNQRQVTVTDERDNQTTRSYWLETGTLTTPGKSYTLATSTSPLAPEGGFETRPIEYEWQNGLLTTIKQRYVVGTQSNGRNTISMQYTPTGRLVGLDGGYPGVKMVQTTMPDTLPIANTLPESVNFASGTSQLAYIYNVDGFVTDYSDAQGAVYKVERDSSNRPMVVTRVSDHVTWTYTYDDTSSLGLLLSIRQQLAGDTNDPGYTVKFTWDGLGRLVQIEDEILGIYRIDYHQVKQDSENIFLSEIVITDPGNAITISRFDERNRLIETVLIPATADISHYLQRTTYEYNSGDILGRISAVVHWLRDDTVETPLRTVYRYENVAELEIAGVPVYIGGTQIATIDPYGRSQYAIYDALGRVRETGDWAQHRSQYEYRVDSVRNPRPIDEVNANGLRIIQHDYLAEREIAITQYIFDFGWQLTGVSRTESNPFATTPGSWTGDWRFLSNSSGSINQNVRRLQSPAIGLDEIIWENSDTPYVNGRPQQVQVQRSNVVPAYLTKGANLGITYDFLGRPLTVTQETDEGINTVYLSYCSLPAGQYQVLRSQPGAGAAVNCQNPDAAAIVATYDAHNRLQMIRDEYGTRQFDYKAGGSHVTMKAGAYTWHFTYDAAGRMVGWEDDSATTREYGYDTLGRLVRVSVAGQPEASFTLTYNAADFVIQSTDDTGRGYSYEYNNRGQLVLQQNLLTRDTTSYTYTTLGLLDSVISPLGRVVTYEYNDPVNPTRLTAIITASGRSEYAWNDQQNTVTYADERGQETTYTFDALGALWKIASPEGRIEQLDYNSSGYLSGWQTSENGVTQHLNIDYDFAMNQAVLSAETVENWSWVFGFTPSEQVARVTNPANQVLTFDYDPLGRLTALKASDDVQWNIGYQPNSESIFMRDGFGQNVTLSYDALYRLTQQQSGEASTNYIYQSGILNDGIVNLRVADENGERVYTFSPGDNRHSPAIVMHLTGERVAYQYDAEGQLESIKRVVCVHGPFGDIAGSDLSVFGLETPDVCDSDFKAGSRLWSASMSFRYDGLGQPIRLIDEDQQVESFTYDSVGNLIGYQNADGKTYVYEYDGLNRLSRLTSPGGIDLLLRYNLDDVAGICQGLTENHLDYAACVAQGGELETYMYDGLGRLLSQQFPNGTPDQSAIVNWAYAMMGGGAPTGWGNAALRYTEDGLGLLNHIDNQDIAYRNLGQIDTTADFVLDYDQRGRLTQLRSGSSLLDYSYDDNGPGYTITDAETGATLTFEVEANGLLSAVGYQPGSANENVPVLHILQTGQLGNGGASFQLQWRDKYVMDFNMNRQGGEVFLSLLPPSPLHSDLNTNYLFTPTGSVQRQVIFGSDSAYFAGGVSEGYISVLGYDRNDRLLTLRISDLGSTRLLYQETFVYTDFGQLESEVRQYDNGTQVRIEYEYDVRNQLSGRTVTISAPGIPSTATSNMVFILFVGLIYGIWRRARPLIGIGLVLITLSAGYPSGITDAQGQDTTQVAFSYDYDEHGNLTQVKTGEVTCVQYTYDQMNHLSDVGSSTHYEYDVLNRLTLANSTHFIYAGTAMPFIVHNGQPTYQVQSASGQQLFMATGTQVNPFIYGGQGQVLGVRNLDDTDGSIQPIWLFDPLGRFVTFDPPVSVDNNCQLLAPAWSDTSQRYLMISENGLWDADTNLLFTPDGRAYLPELGRFLQRNPLGPDAQGNVYELVSSLSHPPIRYHQLSALAGLEQLGQATLQQTQADRLSATAAVARFLPSPVGQWENSISQSWQESAAHLYDEMIGLLNLPDWLGRNYNLPAPRIDETTGALLLMPDNAPGQGGFGNSLETRLNPAVWQGSVLTPNESVSALAMVISLAARTTAPLPAYRTYLDQGWLPDSLQLQDARAARLPDYSDRLTPAAVLAHLPRPLNVTQYIPDWLDMLASFRDVKTMRSVDWVVSALESTLPTTPALPPRDMETWRETWFSTDTLGIAHSLTAWRNLPMPEIPVPALGVNDLK